MQLIKQSQRGFSLLEMLVVFVIIGLLTVTGIRSFFSYSQSQSYSSAVLDVEQSLQLAKSRALSRVKPSQCGTNSLRGYQIALSIAGSNYRLQALCGTNYYTIGTVKTLPASVTFAPGSGDSSSRILFDVSTGIVRFPGAITINGYGKTKVISVSSTGTISLQ